MRHIAIRLLGPFEVTIDGELVTRFEYAKVRALLAYLAVESHRPHSRAHLAALLWPDQSDRTARGSLSQALTTLRHALGDRTGDRPVLLADAQSVQLDPGAAIEVDVAQFLAVLRTTDTHAHHSWHTCAPCSDRLQQALDLYRGQFLADFCIVDSAVFEEWAALQREHLLQRALSTLDRLVERAHWRGSFTGAVAYAQRQVALEPFSALSCDRWL
jgi:DNA-binding SARP family transcriptional activator